MPTAAEVAEAERHLIEKKDRRWIGNQVLELHGVIQKLQILEFDGPCLRGWRWPGG